MGEIIKNFNDFINEAAKFKNTKDFGAFLKEIDSMPEAAIRKIMGKKYIDTPGFYKDEKKNYDDIFDFMISNMGQSVFDELEQYWIDNVQESNSVTEGVESEQIIKLTDKDADLIYSIKKAYTNIADNLGKMLESVTNAYELTDDNAWRDELKIWGNVSKAFDKSKLGKLI